MTTWIATYAARDILIYAPKWFDARSIACRHFTCGPEQSILNVRAWPLLLPLPTVEATYIAEWKGNAARRVNDLRMEVTKV